MMRTPAGGAAPGPMATRPLPGQGPLLLAMLLVGFVLMAIQLWLLTVALDLLLAGAGHHIWQLALASGAIFLGGLLVLWMLRRRPRVRRPDDSRPGI